MLSSLIGTYASYFLNGATGACIILTEALFFVLTMMFAPKYGMIMRRKLRKANLHVQGTQHIDIEAGKQIGK